MLVYKSQLPGFGALVSKMPFLVPEVLVVGERTVYHFSCAREFVRGSAPGAGAT